MKKIAIVLSLLFVINSVPFASDKIAYPKLAPIDTNIITELAENIVSQKNPEINLDDLELVSITYTYDPGFRDSLIGGTRLHAAFIIKSSKEVEMGRKGRGITYKTLNVVIAPNGDPSKSSTTFGKSTIGADYSRTKPGIILNKFRRFVFPFYQILWLVLFLVIYAKIRKKFVLLFIIASFLAIAYYIIIMLSPQISLITPVALLYAIGIVINIIAVIWCLKFVITIKT